MVTVELGYEKFHTEEILSVVLDFTQQLNITNITVVGDVNLMGRILWILQRYKSKFSLTESQSFSSLVSKQYIYPNNLF